MHTTAVIVGAGQAGLAMSRHLTDLGIDHLVLDRGRVAERWRSERWDSLRTLTPNWMSRLPGHRYDGPDPDGYMTMAEVTSLLAGYARSFDAPVIEDVAVGSARRDGSGWTLHTTSGTIAAPYLVAATGACARPRIPAMAAGLAAGIHQVTPKRYKNPSQLPDGGVLVVGASASGVQLAAEIHASGRPVTIAVGSHTRLPRRYRGLDIHHWLDLMGTLDRPFDSFADLTRERRAPSLQLVGSADGRTLDLAELRRRGVRLAGRLRAVESDTVWFRDDLATTVASADAALETLVDRIDRWAVGNGLDREIDPPDRPRRIRPGAGPGAVNLHREGIATVLWATGYEPDHSWIAHHRRFPTEAIPHHGGIATSVPGLYFLGLPLLRTRKSTFIDGVGADADVLARHLARQLGAPVPHAVGSREAGIDHSAILAS